MATIYQTNCIQLLDIFASITIVWSSIKRMYILVYQLLIKREN